ncbi:hypothetical protein ABT294_11955 [Nonomuraea sp. NPDC000554]|uniref:hypothetical protein n=1 Tax=Nonomuraea sp. NPDC000554 TaxID=3154259 RepID=UPI0033267466
MTASLLEQRYRHVLRLLPASYRAEREEEMVAEFMDMSGEVPDELNPRPRWGEIASVLALSVRIRLGTAPRYATWGETVRLVAVLGVAFHAVLALSSVAHLVLGVTVLRDPQFIGAPGSAERLSRIGYAALSCLWIVAFVALMRGHARPAKVTAALGGAWSLYLFDSHGALSEAVPSVLLVAVPVLAVVLGFHGDAPPARRPWWVALLPLTGVVAVEEVLTFLTMTEHTPWLWPWITSVGLAITAIMVTGAHWLFRGGSPSLPLALAVLGAVALSNVLPELRWNFPGSEGGIYWTSTLIQCVALGVMTVTLTVAGLRAVPSGRAVAAGRP